MDLSTFEQAVGLASSAATATGQAATAFDSLKKLFSGGKAPDNSEALALINSLANDLTYANMTNVKISEALRNVREELRRDDHLERQKARYKLVATSQGAMVYQLREDMADGEPPHFICPVCLNKDRLVTYLQGTGDYKQCQTVRDHLYQFTETEWRQPSHGRDDPFY